MSNPFPCGSHGDDEWVTIDSLEPYYQLVHRTAGMGLEPVRTGRRPGRCCEHGARVWYPMAAGSGQRAQTED